MDKYYSLYLESESGFIHLLTDKVSTDKNVCVSPLNIEVHV